MMSEDKILKIFKWNLIATGITLVIASIVIVSMFYGIRNCEVDYGEIVAWGFQNPDDYSNELYSFKAESSDKFFEYRFKNMTTRLDINETNTLETMNEVFPVGKDYIFTMCNGTMKGITRRSWVNDVFFYKLANFI